jgi:hypothetical protein
MIYQSWELLLTHISRTPPCAEMIGEYQDALITNLERTPTEGPTYKASWNLWGLFVASLGCFARSLESKTARVESEMVRVMSIWSGLRVNSSRSVREVELFLPFLLLTPIECPSCTSSN